MNVLHQNAASLVNTKSEHNGPDQVGHHRHHHHHHQHHLHVTQLKHDLAGVDSLGVHHFHQEPGSQGEEG